MLTKQEREAIAERANECVAVCGSLYEVLLGHRSAGNTTYEEDMNKLLARIIDLCDTSNMIELPVDKDGEPIHIGDVLYDDDGREISVSSIRYSEEYNAVITCYGEKFAGTYTGAQLTHKTSVTVQTISERMQSVIDEYKITDSSNLGEKLLNISDQLKELAGKDD